MRQKNRNPEILTVLRLNDDLTVPIVIQLARGSRSYHAVLINGLRKASGESMILDDVREFLPSNNNGNG